MKKILLFCIMAIAAISMSAQSDVTTFLGIPVDGSKSEMKQKLVSKGFVPKKVGENEFLEGEFNGTKVRVFIVTNNNKVYRIMLCDVVTQNEADIKLRFNRLVDQFENNKRYTSIGNHTLPDDEKISYEMAVNQKNYDASFYQVPNVEKIDTLALQEELRNELLSKYTEDELKNPSEEKSKEIQAETIKIGLKIGAKLMLKKSVWFRICESYGEYFITMYYDNEYNHANGEDL